MVDTGTNMPPLNDRDGYCYVIRDVYVLRCLAKPDQWNSFGARRAVVLWDAQILWDSTV